MNSDIEHPVLGMMRYDPRFSDWNGILLDDGKTAILSVSALDEASARQLLDQIAAQLPLIPDRIRAAKHYAASQLLTLKNESWPDIDDDTPLSPQQFVDRLTLDSLSFQDDFSQTLTFADGDLFYGHVVQVSLETDGQFSRAVIAG